MAGFGFDQVRLFRVDFFALPQDVFADAAAVAGAVDEAADAGTFQMQFVLEFERPARLNHAIKDAPERNGNFRQLKKAVAETPARAPGIDERNQKADAHQRKKQKEQGGVIVLLPDFRQRDESGKAAQTAKGQGNDKEENWPGHSG